MSMDGVFYGCLNGERDPIQIIEEHGPYVTDAPNGETEIRFGNGRSQPAPAEALAAIAALTVEAPESGRAARLLSALARRGAAGVILQSTAMQSALNAIGSGTGQESAVALAAQLSDPRANPRLTEALFDTGEIRSESIFYRSPASLDEAAMRAIRSRYSRAPTLDHALLGAYREMLNKHGGRAVWELGYLASAQAIVSGNPRAVFSPGGQKRLDHLEKNPPQVSQVTARFNALNLPRRRQSGNGPAGGAGGTGGSQTGGASMPQDRSWAAQRLGGAHVQRPYRAVFDEVLSRFDQCQRDYAATVQGLGALYREHTGLTELHGRAMMDDAKFYAHLLRDPSVARNILANPIAISQAELVQVALAVASLEALRTQAQPSAEALKTAQRYLTSNLKQLLYRGPLDFPEDELLTKYGITPQDIEKYVPKAANSNRRTPLHQLVQLATQVVVFNDSSILPISKKMPPYNAKKAKKGENDAHEAWIANAEQISEVAECLQTELSRRYGCAVPLASNYGYRVHAEASDADATFQVLAICAQLDGGANMPPNTARLQRLVRQVDPNDIGSAKPTFTRLREHCTNTPVQEKPDVRGRVTGAIGSLGAAAANAANAAKRLRP